MGVDINICMMGNKFAKEKNMKNKPSTKEKLGVNENNKKTNRRRQFWEVNLQFIFAFLIHRYSLHAPDPSNTNQ